MIGKQIDSLLSIFISRVDYLQAIDDLSQLNILQAAKHKATSANHKNMYLIIRSQDVSNQYTVSPSRLDIRKRLHLL